MKKILLIAILLNMAISPYCYALKTYYIYDDLNRVTHALYEDGTVFEYDYDNLGNKTTKKTYKDLSLTTDTDGDGSINYYDQDDDNDGMLDTFEEQYGLNLLDSSDASLDNDGDGISNLVESQQNLNPTVNDDNDLDGIINVNDPDDDNDGMPDAFENKYGLNSTNGGDANIDTDYDGTTNVREYELSQDPLTRDYLYDTPIMLSDGTIISDQGVGQLDLGKLHFSDPLHAYPDG